MAIVHRSPFQALEGWEPFHELETIQRRMNRLFDRLMPGGDGWLTGFDYFPSAEIEEDDDAVYVRLEVPGMEPDDIDIEVTENSIAISGERKSERKTEEKGLVRSEMHYGKFERMMSLPAHIKSNEVKAEYKNGILHLTLPKVEQERHKKVKVELSS